MWCKQCHNERCSYKERISLSQLHYSSTCRNNSGSIPACEPCTELMTLESEIRNTANYLQILLGKHQNMKMRMNREHSRIIHHLPPEIMGNIFVHCIPEDIYDDLKKADSRDIFMPFKLGSVSRVWRRIAWSTPQLWTHLALFGRPMKKLLGSNFVQEWIERSKILPLSIYIGGMDCIGFDKSDGGPPTQYRPLLQALAGCSDRWSNINIELRDNFLLYLSQRVTATTDLRALRLRTNPFEDAAEVSVFFQNMVLRPRKVSMWNIYPEEVNVEWSCVTHVELEDLHVEGCLELMRNAPLLESCRFPNVRGNDHPLQQPCPPVVMERLQHLDFESSRHCHIFFASLVLPSLSSLSLCIPSLDPDVHSTLLPFLERSSFSLVKLSFPEVPAEARHLKALLKATPSVTHLYLGDFLCNKEGKQKVVIDPFIRFLSITYRSPNTAQAPPSSRILPHLQSLDLSLGYLFNWSDHVLGIFGPPSEFNKPFRRPLKSLTITDNPLSSVRNKSSTEKFVPRRILTRIMDLKKAGARITYNHHGGADMINVSWQHYNMLNAEVQSSGSE